MFTGAGDWDFGMSSWGTQFNSQFPSSVQAMAGPSPSPEPHAPTLLLWVSQALLLVFAKAESHHCLRLCASVPP